MPKLLKAADERHVRSEKCGALEETKLLALQVSRGDVSFNLSVLFQCCIDGLVVLISSFWSTEQES